MPTYPTFEDYEDSPEQLERAHRVQQMEAEENTHIPLRMMRKIFLTDRELLVESMTAKGYTTEQISDLLGVKMKTVRSYQTNILKKKR